MSHLADPLYDIIINLHKALLRKMEAKCDTHGLLALNTILYCLAGSLQKSNIRFRSRKFAQIRIR